MCAWTQACVPNLICIYIYIGELPSSYSAWTSIEVFYVNDNKLSGKHLYICHMCAWNQAWLFKVHTDIMYKCVCTYIYMNIYVYINIYAHIITYIHICNYTYVSLPLSLLPLVFT